MHVRWRNFRSFEDTGWIELRPLTLVIGANNTGKSSLYAPLLLLKQTQESRSYGPALLLRGDYVNAGSYADVVHNHEIDRCIEFSFRIDDDDPLREFTGDDSLGARELTLEFRPDGHDVVLQTYTLRDAKRRVMLQRKRLKSGRYSITGSEWRGAQEDLPKGPVSARWTKLVREERPSNFLFRGVSPFEFIAANSSDSESEDLENPELQDVLRAMFRVNGLFEAVGRIVHIVLGDVSYLGPLRAEPRRWYEISPDRPQSVGVRGENAAELTFRDRDKGLKNLVEAWLDRFGFGSSLEFTEYEPELFALLLARQGGMAHNYADCGFGASQVLPIITQMMMARPGGMVIIEQPEIHLNPSLQAILGDLATEDLSNRGAVIIETHSEHLLMRLRTLIAKRELDAASLGIYFTSMTPNGSSLRSVAVAEDGFIEEGEWPDGFFSESLTQAFELSAAQIDFHRG